jgi:hypothetical protein
VVTPRTKKWIGRPDTRSAARTDAKVNGGCAALFLTSSSEPD